MGSKDIHHFTDNKPEISRRSLLKGLAKGTAAGVFLPLLDFGQMESSLNN